MTTNTMTTTINKMTLTSNTKPNQLSDVVPDNLYNKTPDMVNPIHDQFSKAYKTLMNQLSVDARSFSKIRILSENKVVEVTFADGQKVKTICDNESEFSLEFALYLSLAKRLYSDKYTSEGVWKKAQDLKYEKYFVKLVQDGLKMYKKEQKVKEEAEKRAEEERQIIERKKAKKIAYKKRREERRKADQVDAIVQAMKIVNETK